jgi:hypothetical protein
MSERFMGKEATNNASEYEERGVEEMKKFEGDVIGCVMIARYLLFFDG